MTDLVGRRPVGARRAAPLNPRLLGALLALVLVAVGADRAVDALGPARLYVPHPVLGYVRRPGPDAVATWRGGTEVPWPPKGQGLRILILGAPMPSGNLDQNSAPAVARLVQSRLQEARPGTPITVGASLQLEYDMARIVLLADRLVPELRPDILVLTVFRASDREYGPAPPGRALPDRLREILMRSAIVQSVFCTLRPNSRTRSFVDWPSEVLERQAQAFIGASGQTCRAAARALVRHGRQTRVLVLLSRRSLKREAPSYAESLETEGVPHAWLDEAKPVETNSDLGEACAAALEGVLP